MDMNYKQVKELLEKNKGVLERIGKVLVARRNSEAVAICEMGKGIIQGNMGMLWMV